MTNPEWSSRYKCIRKPSLHNVRSFSRLKFQNRTFFQIEDLRHPDDTFIHVTADVVNFVTNAEYV